MIWVRTGTRPPNERWTGCKGIPPGAAKDMTANEDTRSSGKNGSTGPLEHLQVGDLPRSQECEALNMRVVRTGAERGEQWAIDLTIPTDWGDVTVCLPAPEARKFRDEVTALLEEIDQLPTAEDQ